MKDLKELNGVKVLSKTEQKTIKGRCMQCDRVGHNCLPGWYCHYYGDPIPPSPTGVCERGAEP